MADANEVESIATNKPYKSPVINTFDSHVSKSSMKGARNLIMFKRDPRPVATGQINLDITQESPKPCHVKGKLSKQYKKTNVYDLLKN